MNPLTNVKNLQKINDRELRMGLTGHEKSWHSMYKNSAWIYFGGVSFDLTEGDLLCIFSQYGEIVNINLVRDKKTGKSRGFGFICYEDQRSTILAVDNFNGAKICSRTVRVDHVENYKPPKDSEEFDELTKLLHEKGCAPEVMATKANDEEAAISQPDESQEKEEKAKRKELRKQKKLAKASKKKLKKEQKKKLMELERELKQEKKDDSSCSSRSGSDVSSDDSDSKRVSRKRERPVPIKTERSQSKGHPIKRADEPKQKSTMIMDRKRNDSSDLSEVMTAIKREPVEMPARPRMSDNRKSPDSSRNRCSRRSRSPDRGRHRSTSRGSLQKPLYKSPVRRSGHRSPPRRNSAERRHTSPNRRSRSPRDWSRRRRSGDLRSR